MRLVAGLAAAAVVLVSAVAVALLAGDEGDGRAPASGGLVRIDPATNEVDVRTPIRGHPGEVVVTPGGLWMADFRGGVLWRYEPGVDRLERITSNGEPRDWPGWAARSTWGPTAASCPGWCRDTTRAPGCARTASTCSPARWSRGMEWCGPTGCPAVQRLSTDRKRLRKLVEVFLPFRSPGHGREHACAVPRAGHRGRVAVGARRRLDRRLWQLDARRGRGSRPPIELGFAPDVGGRGGRTGLDHRRRGGPGGALRRAESGRRLEPVRVGRGASGIAAGGGRCGW